MNKSRFNQSLCIGLGLILMIGFALTMATVAQEPNGVDNPPTSEPEAQATEQALEAAWQQEYDNRSIFDFSIAYLIKPNTFQPDNLMSEQVFIQTFGAQIFYTWDEFVQQNAQLPFQIVLIHDSMYQDINVEWTRHAYRNQIMLLGIGMPFEHLVDITGDSCVKEPNPAYADEYMTRVMFFSYSIIGGDTTVREFIGQNELVDCRKNYDVTSPVVVYRGRTNFPMTDPLVLAYFTGMLITRTMDYGLIGNNIGGIE